MLLSSSRTFSSRIVSANRRPFGRSYLRCFGDLPIDFFRFLSVRLAPMGTYGEQSRFDGEPRWSCKPSALPDSTSWRAEASLKSEFFHPFTAGEIAGVAQNSRRERRRRLLNTRSQSFGSTKLPAHPFAPVLAREDGDSGGFRRRRHRASAGCARSVGEGLRLRLRRRPRAPRRGPRERLRSRQARDPRLREPPGEHPHDARASRWRGSPATFRHLPTNHHNPRVLVYPRFLACATESVGRARGDARAIRRTRTAHPRRDRSLVAT